MPGNHFSESDAKAEYFEKHPEQKLLEKENPTRINLDHIVNDDNYEVWLLQCPANINLEEQLIDKSIKMPGKTRVNNIETIAEEFSKPKTITLGYKSRDKFSTGTFSALGRILVREKLRVIRNEITDEERSHDTVVSHLPLPEQMKQRHPLLGANFEDKLILDERIVNRLKYCDEDIEEKLIEVKKEIKTELSYEEDDVVINKPKKKKKRGITESPGIEVQSKKKRMKNSDTGGDESSLAWIKNL